MKLILGIIIFSAIICSLVSIPFADAANGKLTIRGEVGTIYSNESVYFRGKLTDSEGYAVGFAPVVLWENVGDWKYITQGKTDARGEYKITIPANQWDYGKSVNIVAYSSAHSAQSSSFTLKIEKPYSYQVKQQTNNYVQTTPSHQYKDTTLFVDVREGTQKGSHQINPTLRGVSGGSITSDVKIYVDNQYIRSISPYKWSSDLFLSTESFVLTVKFDGVTVGSTTYQPTSKTINVKVDSAKHTQTSSTTQTNSNELYKSAAATKSTYSEILNNIESGIKASEYALSGLNLENSEAKKKIDAGWDLRWDVWQYHGEAKREIDNAQSYINSRNYDYSYKTLADSEYSIYKAKNHLYAVLDELKDARDLEKKYQEDRRSCVLFWCDEIKNTYGSLEDKIKNLESKLDTLESKTKKLETSKNSFTQSIHKNEINQKDQEIKNLENIRKQEQSESDKQERILQERIRQEQRDAEQEKQRLEEQKQRELENQRIRAEQEKQRLEEQKRIEEAKSQVRLLAKESPLIQGIINGGKLNFWVEALPSRTSEPVRDAVDLLIDTLDGKRINGVTLNHVKSYGSADFTINWANDYSSHIGRQIGDHLIVGLGSSDCGGWKPFDAATVFEVGYHEVGHALGQGHSNNPNNVMYASADNKYEYDYKETENLSDGYRKQITFCHSGDVYFSTAKVGNSASYEVYVIPPSTDASDFAFNGEGNYYPDCSGDFRQSYNSFSRTCENLPSGSKLVLYNPSTFGAGSDATIKIEIKDVNPHKQMDFNYESSSRYYSQDQLNAIRDLFENNSYSQLNTR